MVQLGFVLDQSRCIGCHACTIACKSENDVPVGSFRTWVKYTEEGEFPEVKRSFTVLRCNQCTDAPCMTICPTSALFKRDDGIVDLDRKACIGCKSCMQGCPYDALYIHPTHGTAEKCHFCAHRVDMGLAPACAVVCPTEAIVPGDFDDAKSRVSQLVQSGRLERRKEEAGTGPNVHYKAASQGGLDPLSTNASGGFLWANQTETSILEADRYRATQETAPHRTSYDAPRDALWGWRVGAYLWTKSLGAGAFLAGLPLLFQDEVSRATLRWTSAMGLLWLGVTVVLLVADLKRPERFLFILTRPNWSSWLVRGTAILMVYGALLVLGMALATGDGPAPALVRPLAIAGGLFGAGSAAYTGFLFAQAKGRVLWMQRGLWVHLIVQAFAAGAAMFACLGPLMGFDADALGIVRNVLLQSLVVHVLFLVAAGHLAPHGREREFEQAHHLLTRGPFAKRHWIVGVGVGVVLPVVLLLTGVGSLAIVAGVCALIGLWAEEDAFVRAGQALPIS